MSSKARITDSQARAMLEQAVDVVQRRAWVCRECRDDLDIVIGLLAALNELYMTSPDQCRCAHRHHEDGDAT